MKVKQFSLHYYYIDILLFPVTAHDKKLSAFFFYDCGQYYLRLSLINPYLFKRISLLQALSYKQKELGQKLIHRP